MNRKRSSESTRIKPKRTLENLDLEEKSNNILIETLLEILSQAKEIGIKNRKKVNNILNGRGKL